ncbi:hypothetical protein L7F22_015404 [Adiantum nelumboides]|nr:hypothetical protein [Adiantum nelumboides]
MKATTVVKVAVSKIRNQSNRQVHMVSRTGMLRAFVLVELCMSVLVTGDTNSLSHHSDPQEAFDKLPTREASSWNALITGYCKLGHYEGALEHGDEKDLRGKVLMKQVLQAWLPASDALLEMMVFHLPSPAKAQRHRVENQYEGLLDYQYANAIRNCDPEGPLMLYVSKRIPTFDKGQFFSFEQVFSGKVSTGSKAQRHRVENQYEGLLDYQYANAIRNCDPEGPLMLYVSKRIPAFDKGQFFAFEQVFSGKVSTCSKARPIEELAEAMDEGRIGSRDDPKVCSKILAEEFGSAVSDEIMDSIVATFQWATKEGALAKENMRGIAFEDHEPRKASGQKKKVSSKATGESSKSLKFLPKLLGKWNRNKEWDHEQREESREGSMYIQEDVDFAKTFNFYDEKPLSTPSLAPIFKVLLKHCLDQHPKIWRRAHECTANALHGFQNSAPFTMASEAISLLFERSFPAVSKSKGKTSGKKTTRENGKASRKLTFSFKAVGPSSLVHCSWNTSLDTYVRKDCCREALLWTERMLPEDMYLDAFTCVCCVKACGQAVGALWMGKSLHPEIEALELIAVVGKDLMDMYIKYELIFNALKVLGEVWVVVLWTALFASYVNCGCVGKAPCYLQSMQADGVSIKAATFACVWRACGLLIDAVLVQHECFQEALQCGDQVEPKGLPLDTATLVYRMVKYPLDGFLTTFSLQSLALHTDILLEGEQEFLRTSIHEQLSASQPEVKKLTSSSDSQHASGEHKVLPWASREPSKAEMDSLIEQAWKTDLEALIVEIVMDGWYKEMVEVFHKLIYELAWKEEELGSLKQAVEELENDYATLMSICLTLIRDQTDNDGRGESTVSSAHELGRQKLMELSEFLSSRDAFGGQEEKTPIDTDFEAELVTHQLQQDLKLEIVSEAYKQEIASEGFSSREVSTKFERESFLQLNLASAQPQHKIELEIVSEVFCQKYKEVLDMILDEEDILALVMWGAFPVHEEDGKPTN